MSGTKQLCRLKLLTAESGTVRNVDFGLRSYSPTLIPRGPADMAAPFQSMAFRAARREEGFTGSRMWRQNVGPGNNNQ
jgi:hypothetical protein